jgi:type II secretory pathway pseudopilin PulG
MFVEGGVRHVPVLRYGCSMRSRRSPAGFTLLEATLAIALTAMAGSAILLGINTSLDATAEVVDKTIAIGMAQQLVDEVVGNTYASPGAGPFQTDLGPNSFETGGVGRERFNDIDDFTGVASQPPKDPYGIALGSDNGQGSTRPTNFRVPANYFSRWRQKVEVYYVNATNFSQRLTGNNTSDYRCVDVTIEYNDPTRGWRPLAQERRVVTYLQSP